MVLRQKIIAMYVVLIAVNVIVWLWAYYALHDHPILFSTAILAYTFGLRHAVDADHIAAIDNVTRKLMQEGKPALSVGLFFSLGHSTVVVLASIAVALTTTTLMQSSLIGWREIASTFCISVSASFLLFIAFVNLLIFFSIYQVFKKVRQGHKYVEEDMNQMLSGGGFLARHLRRLFQIIKHSWQMYPLGLLFGIGFDTATEIAVLGIAASETLNGLSLWSILIFPALFTAGMTLIDTTDCILMIGAYGWAFMKPLRKLYYNMTITFVSVLVALFVGGVETLGLIANKWELQGPIWNAARAINEDFNLLGYIIILVFMVSWLLSVLFYRWLRIEKLETTT